MSKHWLCLTRLKIEELTLCVQAPSLSLHKPDPPCQAARVPTESQEEASQAQENAYVFLDSSQI